jgi:7-carboxy-7-deazaguanine synthase
MVITEIYTGIQGESTYSGLPCTFIRAAGCNLRCSYCDTPYAREGGKEFTVDQVLENVRKREISLVELTGGEPLLQEESYALTAHLLEEGYAVLLETNGSVSLKHVDKRVVKIVDIKCPASGMEAHMDFSNMEHLDQKDEIKFVVCDRADCDWAQKTIDTYRLIDRCKVLISPVVERIKAREVARWLVEKKLPVRLQLQLHKYIWPEQQRGV